MSELRLGHNTHAVDGNHMRVVNAHLHLRSETAVRCSKVGSGVENHLGGSAIDFYVHQANVSLDDSKWGLGKPRTFERRPDHRPVSCSWRSQIEAKIL